MIVITGGTGYIGKNIAYYFLTQGEKVVLLDNFYNSSCESLYELFKTLDEKKISRNNLKFFNLDLTDRKKVNNFFFYELSYMENEMLLSPLKGIIHCAGHKSVPVSCHNPLEYYRNNLISTINIIECLQIYTNIKKEVIPIIFSSTTTVYGDNPSPLNENMECKLKNITSPYGKTKFMIEEILKDCSKHVKAISLRYFNPIGCFEQLQEEINEKSTNIIPTLVKKNKDNINFQIFGDDYVTEDGTCVRDYIDVRDLAKAHYLALEYAIKMDKNYDVFNIGTEKGTSVKELINIIERVKKIKINNEVVKKREGDLAVCFSNSEKAKKLLNWQAEYTFEESIKSINF
jgi:UDP-glucose 4-epimerase